MSPSPLFRYLLIAALLLGGPVACTTNAATGEQSFTAFMSEEKEREVGAEEHPKILTQFGGEYSDAELQAYVERLGQKLAKQSEYADRKFRFFVLNDDTVNAFALPGGYIYVSRGLIALCEDEAELAGVIGHEIGHVTARHSAQRYSASVAANIGMVAIGVLGSVVGAPAGTGDLLGFGASAALQTYSRSQEMEADRLGARYMTAAGYDPKALTDFFTKLDMQTGIEAAKANRPKDQFSVMSTHPRTADRIEQARQLAQQKQVANPVRNRQALLAQVDGLLFGKDPDEGFMIDDAFIHRPLGIYFEFPLGFMVTNGKTAVVGDNQAGTEIIFGGEGDKEALRISDMRAYIAQHWAKKLGVNVDKVDALTVNGLNAATAATSATTKDGRRDIRLVAIRTAPDHIYRFIFITEPRVTEQMSVPLRRMTYSFRKLEPGEYQNYSPPHVRVVTAKSGDTPSALAANMPLKPYNYEWFKALNQNVVGDGLAAGEWVKIVTN